MNGVLGLIQLLLDTTLNQEQAMLANALRESADALMSVIEEGLLFAEIEAGVLSSCLQPIKLRKMVEDCIADVAPLASSKCLNIDFAPVPHTSQSLIGDERKIRQVLSHLLDNAVKFTPSGSIVLSMREIRNGQDTPRIRFEITDTGIGVQPATESRLFQPFVQGESFTTREYGGLGLGLAICYQLVNLMQGDIGYTPAMLPGSTFWFEIPMAVDVLRST